MSTGGLSLISDNRPSWRQERGERWVWGVICHAVQAYCLRSSTLQLCVGYRGSRHFHLDISPFRTIGSKCLYGLECFSLIESDLKPLDFAVNRYWWNYFNLVIAYWNHCRISSTLSIQPASERIEEKFKTKLAENYNRCILVLRDIFVRLMS